MRWSNFETPEGQIISIDMDELVAVINYPGDKADLCLKNGTLHTIIFMGQWKPEARPLPDYDSEILWEEIRDLKLENDRLKKRDEIAQHFIKSVRCKGLLCENCDLHFLNDKGTDLCAQVDHVKLEAIASNVLKKMEEL